MDSFVDDAASCAVWSAAKMGKATLFQGSSLLLGLNAFEPGQEHAAHAHAGSDKCYLVLEGRGEFSVGDSRRTLARGALAIAPAGVPHGVRNAGPGRLLVLVCMAPPPAAK